MKVRLAGPALLAAVVLSVSACGSSSGGATATSAAPLSSAAAAVSSAASAVAGTVSSARSSAGSSAAGAASSAASATSGAFDVCTILPFARAAQLSGQPYTQGTPSSSDGMDGCAYDNADATVPGLNVSILRDEDQSTWSAVHAGGVTDISGLGDKALWDNDNTLYAVKGSYLVQVNGDDLSQATAEALATPALAALP